MVRSGVALATAIFWSTAATASCGSAFCVVNTSWDTHGAWAQPGWQLDMRYEDIRQDQLQAGRRRVAPGEIPRDHDEVSTVNRNWLASAEYTLDDDWGFNVSVPFVKRSHLHLENDAASGEQTPESWNFSEIGDVRAVARRRLATFDAEGHALGTVGIHFGLKLPTGSFNVQNADGERAERPLQPGSGTTDALLGVYYAAVLPLRDLSWFTQAQLQVPLNARDGFRPGSRLLLDAGLRYDLGAQVSLLLQANALLRGRDSGAEAEREDSGGQSLFLSPGISVAATRDIHVYAFLQAPLYQYVNGVQLVARPAGVIGVSARF